MDNVDVSLSWGKLLCGEVVAGIDTDEPFCGVGTLLAAASL